MKEDLKITLERFEYFIQIILKKYKEPPLLLVMFKEGKSVKIVEPTSNRLGDFKMFLYLSIKSFNPDQVFINIPCNDEKYDSILSMRHKHSNLIRQWSHIRGELLDQKWEGVVK